MLLGRQGERRVGPGVPATKADAVLLDPILHGLRRAQPEDVVQDVTRLQVFLASAFELVVDAGNRLRGDLRLWLGRLIGCVTTAYVCIRQRDSSNKSIGLLIQ